MITGAEITFGFQALKSALGIAKEAKDLTDSTAIKAKIIEMQSLILEAQSSAIEAREAYSSQIDRIRELEAEIRGIKAGNTDLERYELRDLGWGAFAYMLKAEARGNEPPHWVCANCYKAGKVRIIQYSWKKDGKGPQEWRCPDCNSTINPSQGKVDWLD